MTSLENKLNANFTNLKPISRAFENQLILIEIFELLSVDDLKACRLVCHTETWSMTCTFVMRKKCRPIQLNKVSILLGKQVGVLCYPRERKYLSEELEESLWLLCIKKLTDLINASRAFPCCKFAISHYFLENSGTNQTLKEFWMAVSGFATMLAIEYVAGHNGVLNCTLEALVILKLDLESIDDAYHDLTFFEEILKHSSNLNVLSIKCSENPSLLTNCIQLMKKLNFKSIAEFELVARVNDEHLILLQKLELKLRQLKLNFGLHSRFCTENFYSFLQTQSEHLISLSVAVSAISVLISFPQMKYVNNLDLRIWNWIGPNYPKFVFAQHFPNLRKLVVRGSEAMKECLSRQNKESLETLSILHLLDYRFEPGFLAQALRTFPNLKQLKIRGNLKVMSEINSVNPKLDELILNGRDFVQNELHEVLTGYTKMELDEIEYLLKENGQIFEDKTKRPMAFLHNVKILRVENVYINDLLCYLGPMKLKSLKCLDLWENTGRQDTAAYIRNADRPFTEISKPVLEKMRRIFTVLIRNEHVTKPTKFEQATNKIVKQKNLELEPASRNITVWTELSNVLCKFCVRK